MTATVAGPSAADIERCLDTVHDPCSLASGTPMGIAAMGLLRDSRLDDGVLTVTICVTGPGCTFVGLLAERATRALQTLPGVRRAEVRVDPAVVWSERMMAAGAQQRLAEHRALRWASLQRDSPGLAPT